MDEGSNNKGMRRRRVIAALGGLGAAGAALPLQATSGLASRGEVKGWDVTTDVLVSGAGAAGVCAALAARAAGVRVLVLESGPEAGGTSALSAGVVYAGGGTALQRALDIKDSPESMYDFLISGAADHPQPEKVQRYCEDSAAHFDWLIDQGVPYNSSFSAARGLPAGDESLFYSGNELAWPAIERAVPAPRGHVPAVAGSAGGAVLMDALLRQLRGAGVTLRTGVRVVRLIAESDGRIIGAVAETASGTIAIRARRGVVLACGGFIRNRDTVQQQAPALYPASTLWGSDGDRGEGIQLGIAAGAATLRLYQGAVSALANVPATVLGGIVVNEHGQRFIAEDTYSGLLGDAIAYRQGGRVWLITDVSSHFPVAGDIAAESVADSATLGDLAVQLGLPEGALQQSVALYNRFAVDGEDLQFHKQAQYVRPLQGPPYRAWDLSLGRATVPVYTLGGLHTDVDGRVLDGSGEAVPGLYAVGRTVSGLPTSPCLAEGLSLADATYFGRRAGAAATTTL